MNGVNRVTLLGNLGQDPELRMTNSGQAVLKMRLATSETYLDRNKVRQERTEWHTVVLWGKRAEALAKFVTKGARVYIEGGIRTRSYEDRDGNKRYSTEVNATEVILCDRGPQQQTSPRAEAFREALDKSPDPPEFDDSDEIPF